MLCKNFAYPRQRNSVQCDETLSMQEPMPAGLRPVAPRLAASSVLGGQYPVQN